MTKTTSGFKSMPIELIIKSFLKNCCMHEFVGIRTIRKIPSSLLISSYFWAKIFFFAKISSGYPIIFSGIEVCTVGAYAFC